MPTISECLADNAWMGDASTTYDFYLGLNRTSKLEAAFRLYAAKECMKKGRQLTQAEAIRVANSKRVNKHA